MNKVEELIGSYVLVRTYSAGVYVGYLKSRNGREVVLANARMIHYWNKAAGVNQIAVDGIGDLVNSRLTVPVETITLLEAIAIIPCTAKAQKCLEEFPEWKK